ncbi:MAG: [Lachnospiraceae bacterium]|nr:[FeFe] hydrogenase H-cluster maturation GTPase HydF [Lachnospiraceae bacterium]
MGLNDTPKGERIHIALFGKRNAGKSSLVNEISGQELSIVSETKGTTTDPVYKAMEIAPIGPVMLVDTPGLDDEGSLGQMRVEKAKEVLRKADMALLVVDGSNPGDLLIENNIEKELQRKKIPYIWIYNKMDLIQKKEQKDNRIWVSAKTKEGIKELKDSFSKVLNLQDEKPIVRDLIESNDLVVLVVPIDKAAPKGRLILPQQQTIRDILEKGAIPVVVRDTELEKVFKKLAEMPKLVITDSQVFKKVEEIVPKDIFLTSFSILFARYKGELSRMVKSLKSIEQLMDGDKVLMAEGCSHHRQCGDIGTEKIPNWLQNYTGKQIVFETASGNEFPKDLSTYKLIIHCGGCMLNEKEMKARIEMASEQNKPILNYGLLISYMNGMLDRTLEVFNEEF